MAKTIRKKIQATIETTQPKTLWQKTKDWFYNAHSVFLTYVYGAFGLATGIVGYMDWSPLWTMLQTGTNFTRAQLIGTGVSVLGGAIVLYFARTLGTKEVDGHLLPKSN